MFGPANVPCPWCRGAHPVSAWQERAACRFRPLQPGGLFGGGPVAVVSTRGGKTTVCLHLDLQTAQRTAAVYRSMGLSPTIVDLRQPPAPTPVGTVQSMLTMSERGASTPMTATRRRQLLSGAFLGRSILADEDARRRRGE
jgi:hypothetical protein